MSSLSLPRVMEELPLPYRILEQQSSTGSEENGNPSDAVLFVGISLVLGIASRHLLRGTRVPYTVALLVIGIALGSLGYSLSLSLSHYALQVHFSNIRICNFAAEYGTSHKLGKIGDGIRLCKLFHSQQIDLLFALNCLSSSYNLIV